MPFAFVALLLLGPPRFSLNFGGDVMLNAIRPGPRTLEGVAEVLRSATTFANLEVPLTDARTATPRKTADELKKRTQFILRASPDHAAYLGDAGVRVVSLANNHAMDYGEAGLAQMTQRLDAVHISHAGAGRDSDAAQAVVFVRVGRAMRVGLISAMAFATTRALAKTTPATESSAGVNALDLRGLIDDRARTYLADWISASHRGCRVLVVAVHWGIERKPLPNGYQVALGRALIDAGADVVWGNHPHVLQGAEVYKGHPILYSMGNLISPTPATTGILRVTFEGERQRFRFFPLRVSGGRCKSETGAGALAAKQAFRALCHQIQIKYPNPNSHPPRI